MSCRPRWRGKREDCIIHVCVGRLGLTSVCELDFPVGSPRVGTPRRAAAGAVVPLLERRPRIGGVSRREFDGLTDGGRFWIGARRN